MNQLERTLTSLEIAEMVGREHAHVMRDIRTIINHLGDESKSGLVEYFIESTYRGGNGQQRPCFNLTKKGCELYSTRMTGEKGTQFAVAYIERFNEMEQRIKEQPQQVPSLEIALQAALEHEREIKTIKSDVQYLKGSMRIDSLQQQEIQQYANQSVVHALGGYESNAYQEIKGKVYSAFWKEVKNHFKVPRYGDIPKVKFDEALRFIDLWRPSTSLQMEIDSVNSQMRIME